MLDPINFISTPFFLLPFKNPTVRHAFEHETWLLPHSFWLNFTCRIKYNPLSNSLPSHSGLKPIFRTGTPQLIPILLYTLCFTLTELLKILQTYHLSSCSWVSFCSCCFCCLKCPPTPRPCLFFLRVQPKCHLHEFFTPFTCKANALFIHCHNDAHSSLFLILPGDMLSDIFLQTPSSSFHPQSFLLRG